jgi:putative ABC transport system permease protein
MTSRLLYRNLRQHLLGTVVTACGIALATGLLMTVWVLKSQAAQTFSGSSGDYDAVLGARGSKLQIVLNALFHLDRAPGTVSQEEYRAVARNPVVATAIPLASGDNYRGWRIVGVGDGFFAGKSAPRVAQGRLFAEGAQEAVLGWLAAKHLGLSLGDHFHPSHGAESGGAEHEESYVVCGILAPSNSPADRVLWIPLEGVQHMSGHDPIHAEEVTAVLLRFRSPAAGFLLDRQYNQSGGRLTLAFPVGAVVAELFGRFAWIERLLGAIAWLVVLVAAGSILAALTNTLQGRRRDLAILRALGASRAFLFRLILGEALCTGAVGALLGFGFYLLLASLGAMLVREQTGVVMQVLRWNAVFLWAPLAVTGLAVLSGLWPAWRVHQSTVAEALTPLS